MKLGLRLWILIIVLLLSLLSIAPWKMFDKGVSIKSVEANSTAFNQGLKQGQTIEFVDGKKIDTLSDFSRIISEKNFSSNNSMKTVIITNQGEFILFSDSAPEITVSELPKSNIKTGFCIWPPSWICEIEKLWE